MDVLTRFNDLVQKLSGTNGRLEKEAYLREVRSDSEVLQILKFLFDPYTVSGISGRKLKKILKAENTEAQQESMFSKPGKNKKTADIPETFGEVLTYFREHNTGRDEDIRFLASAAQKFADSAEHIQNLVFSIIKQDLRLGIQAVTLNKVFGEGFVPKFDVMLAEKYSDNKDFLDGHEFIITEKLDGVRAVLIFSGETPTFFSRQGKAVENLEELSAQVMHLPRDFIYDGELLLENKATMPSKDLYRATVKVTSSDGTKRGVIFNIFDMPDKEAFMQGQDLQPCIERKERLHAVIEGLGGSSPAIREVKMLYVGKDRNEIDRYLRQFTSNDGEGVMVNTSDGAYECKRTKNILKVKQFNTADVRVLSAEEGSGANRGKLGAVIVEFIGPDGVHYNCKVGSGFKQEEREYFFQNQNEIVGRIIEIGYFELSRNQNDNKYSLRFPTFKHLRNDKDEISMH